MTRPRRRGVSPYVPIRGQRDGSSEHQRATHRSRGVVSCISERADSSHQKRCSSKDTEEGVGCRRDESGRSGGHDFAQASWSESGEGTIVDSVDDCSGSEGTKQLSENVAWNLSASN